MDCDGRDGEMRSYNVRYCAMQERYHSGTLVIRHQWIVLHCPSRAYSVLEWSDLGKVQLIYIKMDENYELHCSFLTLFKDMMLPFPQVIKLTKGVGKEILVHIKDKEVHFIRVCDYPDTYSRLNNALCWLGDFPLYSHYKIENFSFLEIVPIHFRFDSHDTHAASYLCKYVQKITSRIYYDIIRVVYKPPMNWRLGRGAKTDDRSSIENYFTERIPFRAERYMDLEEFENSWENETVIPLESSTPQLIPLQIACLNSQKMIGPHGEETGKKRFKISIKSIPLLNTTGETDFAWPNEEYMGKYFWCNSMGRGYKFKESINYQQTLKYPELHDKEMKQIIRVSSSDGDGEKNEM